MRDQVKGETT